MLLGRCQHEETKLREKVGTMDKSSPVYNLDTCCIFSPEIMCLKSGFHFRVETVPINDIVSFSLDMELLQELSKIVLLDDQDLQHVSLYMYFVYKFGCYWDAVCFSSKGTYFLTFFVGLQGKNASSLAT